MLKLKLQFLVTWREELTHLKRPWCWERLKVGGEGNNRGWDGWMVSLTQWTWVWVNSGSWWWTGRPGVLRFMGSQRVGHEWATELKWSALNSLISGFIYLSLLSFFLLYLTKGFLILFVLVKNQLLVLLTLSVALLVSISFISSLMFIKSLILLTLGFIL